MLLTLFLILIAEQHKPDEGLEDDLRPLDPQFRMYQIKCPLAADII